MTGKVQTHFAQPSDSTGSDHEFPQVTNEALSESGMVVHASPFTSARGLESPRADQWGIALFCLHFKKSHAHLGPPITFSAVSTSLSLSRLSL
jgi:hypothetical protein